MADLTGNKKHRAENRKLARYLLYIGRPGRPLKIKYMDTPQGTPKPAINAGTANATVQVKGLENIKGETLYYCVIDTVRGRVAISIGEKNHKALQDLLQK